MATLGIRWRRLDGPGMESCELTEGDGGPALRGTAAGAVLGKPFALRYRVDCDASWRTLRASVHLEMPGGARSVELAQQDGAWRVDGAAMPRLDGCIDVDLAFSPSTNTLALRRLALEAGELGSARAAWVRFPSLEVQPLDQQYRRVAPDRYRYRSGDAGRGFRGAFRTVLTVGSGGLVLEYPGFWRAVPEAGAEA